MNFTVLQVLGWKAVQSESYSKGWVRRNVTRKRTGKWHFRYILYPPLFDLVIWCQSTFISRRFVLFLKFVILPRELEERVTDLCWRVSTRPGSISSRLEPVIISSRRLLSTFNWLCCFSISAAIIRCCSQRSCLTFTNCKFRRLFRFVLRPLAPFTALENPFVYSGIFARRCLSSRLYIQIHFLRISSRYRETNKSNQKYKYM